MSELDQTLVLGTSFVILLGTLAVFIWQWYRNRGGRED